MKDIIIRRGRKEDAGFLAEVVTGALGDELCLGLAGAPDRLPLVDRLFSVLAARPDSQYSYRNAFVAELPDGTPLGGVIAYDGARLRDLRRAFVEEARAILGWTVTVEEAENWGDEADAGEIYIDSLYVRKDGRRHGVATALIDAVAQEFEGSPKPLGLLVEPENHPAIATYRRLGFREVGVSDFFSTPMTHMQRPRPVNLSEGC